MKPKSTYSSDCAELRCFFSAGCFPEGQRAFRALTSPYRSNMEWHSQNRKLDLWTKIWITGWFSKLILILFFMSHRVSSGQWYELFLNWSYLNIFCCVMHSPLLFISKVHLLFCKIMLSLFCHFIIVLFNEHNEVSQKQKLQQEHNKTKVSLKISAFKMSHAQQRQSKSNKIHLLDLSAWINEHELWSNKSRFTNMSFAFYTKI